MTKLENVEKVLTELCDKLEDIKMHPAFRGVFDIAQTHFGMYKGPTWEKEYNAARLLLSKKAISDKKGD